MTRPIDGPLGRLPEPAACYEIVVEGQLDEHWLDWFAGLQLANGPDGTTRLSGCLSDQSALQGVINRVFDLNLKLISVRRIETERNL